MFVPRFITWSPIPLVAPVRLCMPHLARGLALVHHFGIVEASMIRETLDRVTAGETMREISLSYAVDHSTISRLMARHAAEMLERVKVWPGAEPSAHRPRKGGAQIVGRESHTSHEGRHEPWSAGASAEIILSHARGFSILSGETSGLAQTARVHRAREVPERWCAARRNNSAEGPQGPQRKHAVIRK